MTETETTRQIEAIDAQYDSIPEAALKTDAEVLPEEPKPQPTTWEDMDDIPTMWMGNEKYGKEETIRIISLIEAYNCLFPETAIKYKTEMKPLDKEGKNKGKLQELSTPEIKECLKNGAAIARSLKEEWKTAEAKIDEAAHQKYVQEELARQERLASVEPVVTKDTDVLKIFLDAFHVNSAQFDDEIAKLVLLSFLGTTELSGDGLHLKVSGESGEGKSYSVNAALFALPLTAMYKGAYSDKSLIYDNSMLDGTVVKIDEAQGKTEAFESLLKEAISSYQDGVTYRTVIDKETVIKIMKPRMTFIVLSVDNFGDEQTMSRFVPLQLSKCDTKSSGLTKFRLGKRSRGEQKLHTNEVIDQCRTVLQHFKDRKFKVIIPFTENIKYNTKDQRIQEWFEACILYSAVLHYQHREKTEDDDGTIIVTASKEDFDFCKGISHFKVTSSLEYRLDDAEINLIKKFKTYGLEGREVSRRQILDSCKSPDGRPMSDGRLTQIMNGRLDRKGKENGLCSKFGITEYNLTEAAYANEDEKFPSNRKSAKGYSLPVFPDIGTLGNTTMETHCADWINLPPK